MTVTKSAFFKTACSLVLSAMAIGSMAACHRHPAAEVAATAPQAAKNPDEASQELPSDIYQGMPIYPGAQIVHVRKPKGAMREVIFQIKNSPPLNQMIDYYKDGLKKGDFKITSTLTMAVRKTWSCDFHKEGRPGSVMLYPADNDKSSTTVDLIYEVPSNMDASLLEQKEKFDVIGPGEPGAAPGAVTPVAQTSSQNKPKRKNKAKRN
jgi:hypothetical protein